MICKKWHLIVSGNQKQITFILNLEVLRKIKISGIVILVLIDTSIEVLFAKFYTTEAPLNKGEVENHVQNSNNQTLEIYFPTQDVFEKRPVVFFIHGGAWIGGSKESININRINGAVNNLRDAGFVVVSPNYTLAEYGKSPFPQNIKDVYEAIDFIKIHSSKYHIDSSRLGLFGESAGAHIAMMLAFSEPKIYGLNKFKPQFDYLVDVYGPNDLLDIYESGLIDTINASISALPNSIQNRLDLTNYLLGYNPESDSLKAAATMNRYSPIHHLDKSDQTPCLIIQGDLDRLVPVKQSIYLKNQLDSFVIDNEIHILKAVDHAFLYATEKQKDSVQNWISSFIIDKY
jgi:acetyl esterase/lipase